MFLKLRVHLTFTFYNQFVGKNIQYVKLLTQLEIKFESSIGSL